MPVAKKITESLEKSSWIRKMFEEGARLKKLYGDENVFDFSLGNPDLNPPHHFFDALKELSSREIKGIHGYMPNAGFPSVKERIAEKASFVHGVSIPPENIVMTCGAAGGLNIILKTILDPGDEIIVPKPYFVEYNFYVSNHGGVVKLANTNSDFSLNCEAIKNMVTRRTKAVLINSPNNPTGRVYDKKQLSELASMLNDFAQSGQIIYLIMDEPYREIIYDGIEVPPVHSLYSHTLVVTSYSKTLSLAGERIGYVSVNPACEGQSALMAGLVLSNRILGYVNAPALMQRIISQLTDVTVDVSEYKKRRDILAEGLTNAGYSYTKPEGTFYIFCESPIEDDIAFVSHLQKYNILTVPGTGFGGPGYFRIAYCIPPETIERALPKFKEAIDSI